MIERVNTFELDSNPQPLVNDLRALVAAGDFPTSFAERVEEHIYVIDGQADARQPWMPPEVRDDDELQKALEQLQDLVSQEIARS